MHLFGQSNLDMQSDLSITDGLDGFGDACYVIRLRKNIWYL